MFRSATKVLSIGFVFFMLCLLAACEKEQPLVPVPELEKPSVNCDSICHDTLSLAKQIAYHPYKIEGRVSLGNDLGGPSPYFWTDYPAGTLYRNGMWWTPSGEMPATQDVFYAHFSANNLPVFTIDLSPNLQVEYDLMQFGSKEFMKYENNFHFLVSRNRITQGTIPHKFEQVQIEFSTDLREAYIYYYGEFYQGKGSDMFEKRDVYAYRLSRESVPACKCKSELVNYP